MTTPASPPSTTTRQTPHELWRGVRDTLWTDVAGGVLLLSASVLAIVLANTPAVPIYEAVRDFRFGPESLHLNLSVGPWAADGLLAIFFFFVVGLELKEEFVARELRNPRAAALPIAAAVGGVVVPALVFVAVNARAAPKPCPTGRSRPSPTSPSPSQ